MPLTRLRKRLMEAEEAQITIDPNENRAVKKPRKNNQKKKNVTSVTTKRNAKQINKRQITNTTHSNAMPPSAGPETMQGVIPALNQLDRLPAEIIFEIIKYLPPTTFLQLGFLCRRLYQVVCDAPVWEKIWRTAGLKKPARKSKSYREVVLVEAQTICERCYGKSKASGSNSPIKIMDTDDNLMISLCCECRCDYYNQHPEPYEEEQAEGSTQGQRHPKITKMRAKSKYRLTDEDLQDIAVDYARNPHYRGAAPMCLYDKQEVIQMARIVHGGDIGIEAARNATIKKGNAMIETRRRNKEARKAQLEQLLAEANIPDMINNHRCRNYIQSSRGINLASIIIELQAEAERLRLIESRKLELTAAVEAAGLQHFHYNAGYDTYIYRGTGSVEDIISQMRRQEEERRNREARRLELTAAVKAAGIQNTPYNMDYHNYIDSGTGSVEDIISQMRRQEEERRNREARSLELMAAVKAAGIQNTPYNADYHSYINSGTGSVEDVISQMRRQEEVRRTRDARRLELRAAMETAGLRNTTYNQGYHNYIDSATGSVEDVISQMRRQVEAGRSQDARRQELTRKLAASGLTLRSDSRLCQQYITSGTGDADSIVDTMKEMDWFFRCTNYATSRKTFYDLNGDSDYDTDDDDDDDYNEYHGGGWWLNDHDWREARRRYHIDSERGKNLALQTWLTNRFERRLYQSVEHDQNDPSRPPRSLWPTINEKWQTALQTHAVRKLAPHYRTYYQTMIPVAGETLVSESQVIGWLDQPEGAIGIPLSTLLSRIIGENWHQKLIARTSAI